MTMREKDSGHKSEKKRSVVKLIPPRPTFPDDLTQEEMGLTRKHVAYWTDMADSERNGEAAAHPAPAGGSSPWNVDFMS
jgi:N-dimethylarginine dimethylaminohydrolase